MKKNIILLLALFYSLNCFSQMIWEADLDNVSESGYHYIEIDQRLIGASNNKLRDLKILKTGGEEQSEVPYFIQSATPVQEVNKFRHFTLAENTAKDSLNIIIVENKDGEELGRFYLLVGNAEVDVRVSIRGSNDRKQWYIVKKSSTIPDLGGRIDKDKLLTLDFPKGNYPYYEIKLVNNQGSPLEVKAVSQLESSNIYGQFTDLTTVTGSSVEQKDKKSYIRFENLADRYQINKVEFYINSNMEYLRTATLTDSVNKNKQVMTLSSKGENLFFLDNFKLGKEGYFVIDNHNNPPLTIDSVKLYGLKRYACAYLEQGESYYLNVCDTVKLFPNYDIEHFKNEINSDIPVVYTKNIQSRELPDQSREKLLIENPIFLWSVIGIVGIFLLIICIRMIKSMKEKDQ